MTDFTACARVSRGRPRRAMIARLEVADQRATTRAACGLPSSAFAIVVRAALRPRVELRADRDRSTARDSASLLVIRSSDRALVRVELALAIAGEIGGDVVGVGDVCTDRRRRLAAARSSGAGCAGAWTPRVTVERVGSSRVQSPRPDATIAATATARRARDRGAGTSAAGTSARARGASAGALAIGDFFGRRAGPGRRPTATPADRPAAARAGHRAARPRRSRPGGTPRSSRRWPRTSAAVDRPRARRRGTPSAARGSITVHRRRHLRRIARRSGPEELAHPRARLVELRLAGADAALEDRRALLVRQALDVVEHEDRAIAGRQLRRARVSIRAASAGSRSATRRAGSSASASSPTSWRRPRARGARARR